MGEVKTYIIKTSSNEFYCGKTTDIHRRLIQHKKEKYPKWFCNDRRKIFLDVIIIDGDFEKEIKYAKSKNIYNIIRNLRVS